MVDTPSAGGIGATLSRKAGPLPIWAWTGLGVAALAAFMIYRQRKAAAAAAAADASSQTGGAPGTNLGTNQLSNLVPQAYPMPFQEGDVFTNVTTTGTPTTPPPTPTPNPKPSGPSAYVIEHGDTWDSIGKKVNVAPIDLWEFNGSPAGFKLPNAGTVLHFQGLSGQKGSSYADQAAIVAAQQKLVASGYHPQPGATF